MSGFPRSPLAFDDCRALLDRAVEAPKGIRVVCESHPKAMELRARMHYHRKLDRKQNMVTYQPNHPLYGVSIYDGLILKVVAETIIIEKRDASRVTVEDIT